MGDKCVPTGRYWSSFALRVPDCVRLLVRVPGRETVGRWEAAGVFVADRCVGELPVVVERVAVRVRVEERVRVCVVVGLWLCVCDCEPPMKATLRMTLLYWGQRIHECEGAENERSEEGRQPVATLGGEGNATHHICNYEVTRRVECDIT